MGDDVHSPEFDRLKKMSAPSDIKNYANKSPSCASPIVVVRNGKLYRWHPGFVMGESECIHESITPLESVSPLEEQWAKMVMKARRELDL